MVCCAYTSNNILLVSIYHFPARLVRGYTPSNLLDKSRGASFFPPRHNPCLCFYRTYLGFSISPLLADCHRTSPTHALALSARSFLRKKKSLRLRPRLRVRGCTPEGGMEPTKQTRSKHGFHPLQNRGRRLLQQHNNKKYTQKKKQEKRKTKVDHRDCCLKPTNPVKS